MRPPVTIIERLASAGSLLVLLIIIVAAGLLLLARTGRSSPARLILGRYILGWMIAGWVVGGCIGVSLLDNQQYRPAEADVGFAGFGLLAGWLVGSVHGALVVWRRKRKPV
jgi:hypothetical protein